jgi:hypothetical protein
LRIALTYLVVIWTAERIAVMYADDLALAQRSFAMIFVRRQTALLKVQVAILNILYRIRLVRIKQITAAEALQSLGMKRMAGMMVVTMSKALVRSHDGNGPGCGRTVRSLDTTRETGLFRLRIADDGVLAYPLGQHARDPSLGWRALWAARGAMISFLLTNPVGWAILLVSVLVTLYFTWDRFHDAVNRTARFIWQHWFPLQRPCLRRRSSTHLVLSHQAHARSR